MVLGPERDLVTDPPGHASVEHLDAAVVTFTVDNQGTSRGSASCRLEARDANGVAIRATSVTTGQIDGGHTSTFTDQIDGLAQPPASVAATCH